MARGVSGRTGWRFSTRRRVGTGIRGHGRPEKP